MTDGIPQDLIEVMRFVERASAKIHGLSSEDEIFRALIGEFRRSQRYCGAIFLVSAGGSRVKLAETSLAVAKRPDDLQEFQSEGVDLDKVSPLKKVLIKGGTVRVDMRDLARHFLPPSVCIDEKEKMAGEKCIVTPIRCEGRVIGALAVSSVRLTKAFVPSVKNLAEHVSTALEILSAERKYRDLVDNLQVGVFRRVVAPHGAFIEVNPAAIAMFQACSKEDLLSRKMEDLCADTDAWKRLNEKLSKRGIVKNEEIRLKTLKGGIFWASVTAVIRRDNNGTFISEGIIEDITLPRAAKEELEAAKEYLSSVLDTCPDAVIITDLNGRITDCNPAGVRMFEFSSKEELVGRNALELAAECERDNVVSHARKVLNSGSVIATSYELQTNSGRCFPAEISASVLYDSSGKPIGFVLVVRDMTERAIAEGKLRESEERYRELVNSSIDPIISVDKDMNVVIWNHAAEKTFGYRAEEMIGQSLLKVVPKRFHRKKRRGFAAFMMTANGPLVGKKCGG